MPEENAGSGQDPEGGTPPEGDEKDTGSTPPEGDGEQTGGSQATPTELAALRKEAAKYRRELRTAQEKLREHEQAQLSETERLQQRVKELEGEVESARTQAKRATLRSTVAASAQKLGFLNPSVAHRLIDDEAIEWDGDQPKNLEALLRDLLRSDPYLARAGSADGGEGRRGDQGGAQDMNALLRSAAGRGR